MKQFQWNAADYAKHSAAQFGWAQELIDKLKLRGDETVLDIGCGDGKITALISEQLPAGNAVGIDSSQEMVDLAARNHPASRHPNLSFRNMDARNITFEVRFDIVFSNAALHWIHDQLSVLLGVKQCLKQSGRLLFQMAGKGNAREIIEIVDRLITDPRWQPYFHDFSFPYSFLDTNEYKSLLQQAGLEPIRIERIPKDMKQPGKDGLAGWIRTTWLPYTERIPEHLRKAFVSELVDGYVQNHPADREGMIHVAMVRLEVEARKL